MISKQVVILIGILSLTACRTSKQVSTKNIDGYAGKKERLFVANSNAKVFTKPLRIERASLVSYAKTFLGTPYKYGSSIPLDGLDCSGFILNVFAHFNIKTPRTTVDYTNEGMTISIEDIRPGDLLLFTGSDHNTAVVGHMGILTENNFALKFIHAASGRNIGVIESTFAGYYKSHFVKAIRLLE